MRLASRRALTPLMATISLSLQQYVHSFQKQEENVGVDESTALSLEGSDHSTSEISWVPQEKHPCTIPRLSSKEFQQRFGPRGLPPLFPEPLVVLAPTDKMRNQVFRDMTRLEELPLQFPEGFQVTLSSSNSFSEHRTTILLRDYLDDVVAEETLPTQFSNETWYLFGETFSDEWKRLLQSYELPSCVACEREMVALSFGIGGVGSGVSWHVHGPGFSETLHGRKHWILALDRPHFHPNQTSRNWMEYDYPMQRTVKECTLEPGDLLYFPDSFWHATINLDNYTTFVSTFTQEHLYTNNEL